MIEASVRQLSSGSGHELTIAGPISAGMRNEGIQTTNPHLRCRPTASAQMTKPTPTITAQRSRMRKSEIIGAKASFVFFGVVAFGD